MKKSAGTLVAVVAALLSVAPPAWAGSLTVTAGPTFTPETAFTNNTIAQDTTVGAELIRINGGATITPDATNQASIDLSGGYSADAGDTLSAAYSFVVDMNALAGVTYTLSGSAVVYGLVVPFSATGSVDPGLHKYEATISIPGATFPTATTGTWTASLTLNFGGGNSPDSAAPGTLDVQIQQIDLQLAPEAATLEAPAQQQNISTRGDVGTGDNVLIGGFIITGTDSKQVVLRAVGPSIVGVTGLLADPFLELHEPDGTVITNDNWGDLSADDQTVLSDNNLTPLDPAESALVETLAPGQYTFIVRGVNDTTGIALVEAYDIDSVSGVTSDSKLANISTRGNVGVDPDVLIGGFIVGGSGTGFSSVIVRGLGPSLADQGVTGVLADPTIDLINENADLLATNDNWESDPTNAQSITDNNLAPTNSNEAAIYDILPPGKYTVILSGVGGTSGVGLVESYNLD